MYIEPLLNKNVCLLVKNVCWLLVRDFYIRGLKRARPRAGRAVATAAAGPDPGRGLIALTARTLAPPTQ
jgi:hypothetical protein